MTKTDVLDLLLHRERCPASPFGRTRVDMLGPCNCGVVQAAREIATLRAESASLLVRLNKAKAARDDYAAANAQTVAKYNESLARYEAQNAHLGTVIDRATKAESALLCANRRVDELVAVLVKVEWSATHDPGGEQECRDVCPWCDEPQEHGHLVDCRLRAALGAA